MRSGNADNGLKIAVFKLRLNLAFGKFALSAQAPNFAGSLYLYLWRHCVQVAKKEEKRAAVKVM